MQDHLGVAHVAHDRQREAHGQDRAVQQPGPPVPGGRQHVDQGGQDQRLADLADRRGRAERQAGQDDEGQPGPGLPEQQHDPGHQQRLEQHVGHDRLFRVQLVGVQQHRRHGQRGEPAGHAAAQHQEIERDRHPQPQHVLQQRDQAQVPEHQHGLQHEQRVADRVERSPRAGAEVGAEQVLLGVDEQQGGLVGELGDHAQHQPGRDQERQHPVLAQRVAGAPDGPVEARARDGAPGRPGGADRGLLGPLGRPGVVGHAVADDAPGLSVWAGARQYRFAPVDHTNPWHESHQAAGDAAPVPGRLPGQGSFCRIRR